MTTAKSYSKWTDEQERSEVTVDGHELEVAYYRDGEENGDPVVFLHGIPTNSYLFRHAAPAVAEDRRVIAPDMLGYGQSSMHDGFDRSLRVQERMLEGLLSELDAETVSLVGHDLGGGVALRYACHEPAAVDRLVLSNSVAYDSWPIQFITDFGLPETARKQDVEAVQEMLEHDLFRETLYGDDHDETFLEGMLEPWNSEEGVVSAVRNASATNTSHTTEIDPADVEAETQLVWGAEDEFQSIDWAERLEEDIDDCELIGLDEANHWVPEDRPDAYAERLAEFLR